MKLFLLFGQFFLFFHTISFAANSSYQDIDIQPHVLVEYANRYSFGDIGTTVGKLLKVRVGRIEKSSLRPGYIVIPLPRMDYVNEILKKGFLLMGDGEKLEVTSPRYIHIRKNDGKLFVKNYPIKDSYVVEITLRKELCISMDIGLGNAIVAVNHNDDYQIDPSDELWTAITAWETHNQKNFTALMVPFVKTNKDIISEEWKKLLLLNVANKDNISLLKNCPRELILIIEDKFIDECRYDINKN